MPADGCSTVSTRTNSSENCGAIANILIVRLDGIGDALVCTPLLAALRAAGHRVGMALSDRNRDIFAPGALDRRHVLERIPWPRHGSTAESAAIACDEISAARYDVALIASEEPEAYELARGIPVRAGFTTGWAKPLKSLWVRRRLTRRVRRAATVRGGGRAHEVETIFGLAAGLGLHAETRPTADPSRLRPLIADDLPPRGSQIVVQLGAKWCAIGVDWASAGAIIGALADRGAALICSLAERADAQRLAGGAPVAVCPDTDAWKRTIARARIVVTPDTGAAHLAGMIGVPVVDCFPDADADAQIARWRPWAGPYRALLAGSLCGSGGAACIERALDEL